MGGSATIPYWGKSDWRSSYKGSRSGKSQSGNQLLRIANGLFHAIWRYRLFLLCSAIPGYRYMAVTMAGPLSRLA